MYIYILNICRHVNIHKQANFFYGLGAGRYYPYPTYCHP